MIVIVIVLICFPSLPCCCSYTVHTVYYLDDFVKDAKRHNNWKVTIPRNADSADFFSL